MRFATILPDGCAVFWAYFIYIYLRSTKPAGERNKRMKIIKQTNRTILFDVINPERLDLINLMAGIETTGKSLTDDPQPSAGPQLRRILKEVCPDDLQLF